DGVEERLERRADVPVVGAGGAGERVRVERLELRLLLLRAELDEQIERLVEDVVRPGFGTVDLVNDDDRAVAAAQCLPEDERRLAVVDVGDDRDVPDVGALHRPLNVAFRLFTNASTPSFLSSVANRR